MINKMKNFFENFLSKTKDFDMTWFYKINHTKWRCSTLNSFMLAMTQIGEAWLPIIAVLLSYQYGQVDIKILQKILWTYAVSGLVCQVLKHLIDRERPTTLPDVNIVGPAPTTQSFPSGHTTSAFAICSIMILMFPNLWLPMMILAILAGTSRIYLGVHWPTDVFIGSLIGIITSLIVYFL